MQQTEKYKLNLIESSDPFLPEGLNANTQKIEAAMIAHEEGIEQRLVALESLKIAYGRSTSDDPVVGGYRRIYLGSKPKLVLLNYGGMIHHLESVGDVKFYDDGFGVGGQTLSQFRSYIAIL